MNSRSLFHAHSNRGLALTDIERFREAVESFTKAIEVDPEHWYAYSQRGLALWVLGERDAAIQDYERVNQLTARS